MVWSLSVSCCLHRDEGESRKRSRVVKIWGISMMHFGLTWDRRGGPSANKVNSRDTKENMNRKGFKNHGYTYQYIQVLLITFKKNSGVFQLSILSKCWFLIWWKRKLACCICSLCKLEHEKSTLDSFDIKITEMSTNALVSWLKALTITKLMENRVEGYIQHSDLKNN